MRDSSLWGVLCAAEVFVVPWAFDKPPCSSLAKSGAALQDPQVGVGSPAAPCVTWPHGHPHTPTSVLLCCDSGDVLLVCCPHINTTEDGNKQISTHTYCKFAGNSEDEMSRDAYYSVCFFPWERGCTVDGPLVSRNWLLGRRRRPRLLSVASHHPSVCSC